LDDFVNRTPPFVRGVASGDPLADAVILWTRVTRDEDAPAEVPVLSVIAKDQWDGYTASRARLLKKLDECGIGNVVVLTGDIHSSWGMDIAENPFNPASYNAATGAGSVAVEFVTPGVTSPGIEDPAQAAGFAALLRATHPHQVRRVEPSWLRVARHHSSARAGGVVPRGDHQRAFRDRGSRRDPPGFGRDESPRSCSCRLGAGLLRARACDPRLILGKEAYSLV
jgi:phosphodiesterase/alkaline phosphatase D-like protein